MDDIVILNLINNLKVKLSINLNINIYIFYAFYAFLLHVWIVHFILSFLISTKMAILFALSN